MATSKRLTEAEFAGRLKTIEEGYEARIDTARQWLSRRIAPLFYDASQFGWTQDVIAEKVEAHGRNLKYGRSRVSQLIRSVVQP